MITFTAVTAASYPGLAGQRYDIEMTSARVSVAVRNENHGPAADRAACVAGRAARATSPHAYQPQPDTDHPHLARAACRCGWRDMGTTASELAPRIYERHMIAALHEREAARS